MTKTDTRTIPMAQPDITDVEREAVSAVLASTCLSIGPQLTAFENRLADCVATTDAVGVSSGTAGLHLALLASGVSKGDFVVTTPFSFVASANSIPYPGAIPIFVDAEPETGNIDPVLVEASVRDLIGGTPDRWLPPRMDKTSTSGRTQAILPVHVFGQPADMDPLLETARAHELAVVEDACEALGSDYKGRPVGGLGDIGVFAFYPNKQITTGEGGMIVTNRSDWAGLCRSLRNQGRDVFNSWLSHARLGFNYRMNELSAALGLAQLGRLDEMNSRRSQVAKWYDERLVDHPLIEPPRVAPSTTRISWFVYVVRILPPANRNQVMEALESRGIPSRPYFSPIHLQPFYRERFGYRDGCFPVTERLGATSLALPFFGSMSEPQVDRVCEALCEVIPA